MSGTTEAFSRVKIDALPRDAGREFTAGVRSASNARCQTVHSPITSSATSLVPSMALPEAKCASTNPMRREPIA